MTVAAPLASRAFSHRDQQDFASLSGDYNPMHMDDAAARRTPAGACVVHGVQSFLWALEVLSTELPLDRLRSLDADFSQFLYVGEEVRLHLGRVTDKDARAELFVGETRISQYVVQFGAPQESAAPVPAGTISYDRSRNEALPLSWAEVEVAGGRVEMFRPDASALARYPGLSAAIGADRVNGLLALTRLVGMVSPGLHSTFHRISVKLVTERRGDALYFHTAKNDARFAIVTLGIAAPGLSGTVKASRRTPPTMQPRSDTLRADHPMPRFEGHVALVVGGSRGLGEVTAKLLGLAGVHVVISYVRGEEEAASVAADIVSAGGRAETIRLDVLASPANQLSALNAMPTSVYYFATERITGRALPGFSAPLFDRFCAVYVTAFHDLCLALSTGGERTLQVFYPSSVFVSDPNKGMAEYAMAKAAGEVLAADLNRFHPKLSIVVSRLPRVATDQTAGMIEVEMGSPAACMAPLIVAVEQRVDGDL